MWVSGRRKRCWGQAGTIWLRTKRRLKMNCRLSIKNYGTIIRISKISRLELITISNTNQLLSPTTDLKMSSSIPEGGLIAWSNSRKSWESTLQSKNIEMIQHTPKSVIGMILPVLSKRESHRITAKRRRPHLRRGSSKDFRKSILTNKSCWEHPNSPISLYLIASPSDQRKATIKKTQIKN